MSTMVLPIRWLLGSSWRPTLSAIVMVIVVIGFRDLWSEGIDLAWLATELSTAVCVGAITYTGLQLLLWHALGYKSPRVGHYAAKRGTDLPSIFLRASGQIAAFRRGGLLSMGSTVGAFAYISHGQA